MTTAPITCLFLDIGGVLLTDGWDRHARRRAATAFGLFALALDVAHVPADRVLYIDDNAMFVHIAKGLGIRGLCHTGARSTRAKLSSLGLTARSLSRPQ